MPGFDGTGPLGMGAMTGGGRGYCMVPITRSNDIQQSAVSAYCAPAQRINAFRGRGGRGSRRIYGPAGFSARACFGYPTYGRDYMTALSAAGEKEYLVSQAEFLHNQLQQVKRRLKAFAVDAE